MKGRIFIVLAGAMAAGTASAQSEPPASASTATSPAKSLEQVTVTGSRIPRASLEGPSPVTVIDAAQIDKLGFRNAFDALSSLSQNTGGVQGADAGSTFTPAGNFLNLRGLGPNHTLVLINGHRMAEYPVAYNGSVNAVNLANLPSQSIERIEVLSAGASAVYGSDAIAGVVNIILKQHYSGTDLNLRTGGSQGGGGANQRLQLSHGFERGRFDGVFGVELTNQQPIRFGDRRISDSYSRYALDPRTAVPPIASSRNPVNNRYYSPPAGGCDAFNGYLGGSVWPATSPRYPGGYCGSDRFYDDRTVQPQKRQASGFASLHYRLDERTELYADLLYDLSKITNYIRASSWSNSSSKTVAGPFWNDATGRLENWSRTFTPEETGGQDRLNNTYLERSWNASVGARGRLGDGDWHYDINYSLSEYQSDQSRYRLLANIDDYFLGASTGSHDFRGGTFPAYNADPAKLFTPLTAQQFADLSRRSTEHDASWAQALNLSVNGTLFDLPAGPLGFAGTLEAGSQAYHNKPDEGINRGDYYGSTQDDYAGGKRSNYAIGFELNAPLFSQLTATGAARYDHFRAAGNGLGKATYNFGLEYRPIESLLLRGSYATSFRAPDMNYTFATGTRGYMPGLTDYYQCRIDTPSQAYSSCDEQYNIDFLSTGNAKLKPETAKSFSYGLVWSPSSGFDVSVDYYHIVISNEVTNLSADQVLRTEADCRLGQSVSGSAVDPASPVCVDYLGRVARNASNAPVNPNQITQITINPINAASERTSGIDTKIDGRWGNSRWGHFSGQLAYTVVLTHKYQQFPGDQPLDYRNDLAYQADWRSKVNASINWNRNRWNANLYGIRYGSFARNDYESRRPAYVLVNASVGYQLTDRSQLSLAVNNVANKMPIDRSGGWPNYPSSVYDIYGRQWWLSWDYHFGKKRG